MRVSQRKTRVFLFSSQRNQGRPMVVVFISFLFFLLLSSSFISFSPFGLFFLSFFLYVFLSWYLLCFSTSGFLYVCTAVCQSICLPLSFMFFPSVCLSSYAHVCMKPSSQSNSRRCRGSVQHSRESRTFGASFLVAGGPTSIDDFVITSPLVKKKKNVQSQSLLNI